MKKIPTLFLRDFDDDPALVTREINPEAQWVFDGQGQATVKFDGTAVLVRDGQMFKRYTLRRGKTAPEGYEPATEVDPVTGKQEGWVPVGEGPEDKYHREAFRPDLADGTYELVGPKVQGGAETTPSGGHELWRHGSVVLVGWTPPDFDDLRSFLSMGTVEGIVWHHHDGRMAKIKGRDFGFSR